MVRQRSKDEVIGDGARGTRGLGVGVRNGAVRKLQKTAKQSFHFSDIFPADSCVEVRK